MAANGYQAYNESRILSTDPARLTTLLYEGAIKNIRRARLFREDGNHEGFNEQVNKASLIVGELLSTLDHEQGGEIAVGLEGIYVYVLKCLVEAGIEPGSLDEAEKHLVRICEAWKDAVASLSEEAAPLQKESAA